MSSAASSSSSSLSALCPEGYRHDDFLLYHPEACALHSSVHYALSALWVALAAFFIAEMLLGIVLRCFSRTKGLTASVVPLIAFLWIAWHSGTMLMFGTVLADPLASVSNPSQNAALWLGFCINQAALISMVIVRSIMAIRPLLTTLGIDGETGDYAWWFRRTRYFRIGLAIVYVTGLVICFVVLSNALPTLEQRRQAIEAGFIFDAICFLLAAVGMAQTQLKVRSIALTQVTFSKDLPGDVNSHTEQAQGLKLLARRMLISSINTFVFAPIGFVIWALLGSIIPLNWIVAHVLFAGYGFLGAFLMRINARDSILFAAFCCRFNFNTTPHSSSADRHSHPSGSTPSTNENSNGKGEMTAAAPQKLAKNANARISVAKGNGEQPSKLLESINLSELTTPAAAILTLE